MFINNWYVAANLEDLKGNAPMFVRMLGCDFVLFRDTSGEIRCLSDVCCHRGASLAQGKVNGDCIACPYHGWEFDGAGRCTKIPALGADVKPPKRARIDSYPVREKFGWVWVFLGDAPEEERPPFLDDSWFPEYYDEKTWRKVRISYEAPVNWARSEENSIDGAHPSFVHASFGSKRDPKVHIVPVETHDWGASTTRERTPPDRSQKTGAMRELTAEKRGKTKATTAFCFTGVTHRIDIQRADGLRQVTLSHRTPVDEFNTRTFTTQARDYLMTEEFDKERFEGRQKAIAEDIAIVRTVRPPLPPKSTTAELLTEADQLETAFRAMNRRMEEKGWEIDSDVVEKESKRQILVIPSPQRLTDPKNWVHKTVPTTRPRAYLSHAAEQTEAAE
ncbi:MAG: aromatic ring-hydroxylating dioxygenase subunit alpha [Rhodospirillaceae bacterium]|nr:aromatic ring-hydroxylating dioxygenase subunit alpha [Rhodospirillaceae bacterium]